MSEIAADKLTAHEEHSVKKEIKAEECSGSSPDDSKQGECMVPPVSASNGCSDLVPVAVIEQVSEQGPTLQDCELQPLCFEVERYLGLLRSPRVLKILPKALQAGVTSVAAVIETPEGYRLERPDPVADEEPWPDSESSPEEPNTCSTQTLEVADVAEAPCAVVPDDLAPGTAVSSDESDGCSTSPFRRRRSPTRSCATEGLALVPVSKMGHAAEVGTINTSAHEGDGKDSWAALRAVGASGGSLGVLCRHLAQRGGPRAIGVASLDPPVRYLLCEGANLAEIATALVQDGHAVRPAVEAFGQAAVEALSPSGNEIGCSFLAFAGVWGDNNGDDVAESIRDVAELQRLRIVARCGLFVEVHFGSEPRAVAGSLALPPDATCAGLTEAVRLASLDSEPPVPGCAPLMTRVDGNDMEDIPSSCRWKRLDDDSESIAAVQLDVERLLDNHAQTSSPTGRAGIWITCGSRSLRVLGLPHGKGLIGSTGCTSSKQLRLIEGDKAVDDELNLRYEAVVGICEDQGRIRACRGLWSAASSVDTLLCGAKDNEIGARTEVIRYCSGLVMQGGFVTLLKEGSYRQVWKIRELGINPFAEPSLTPISASNPSVCSAVAPLLASSHTRRPTGASTLLRPRIIKLAKGISSRPIPIIRGSLWASQRPFGPIRPVVPKVSASHPHSLRGPWPLAAARGQTQSAAKSCPIGYGRQAAVRPLGYRPIVPMGRPLLRGRWLTPPMRGRGPLQINPPVRLPHMRPGTGGPCTAPPIGSALRAHLRSRTPRRSATPLRRRRPGSKGKGVGNLPSQGQGHPRSPKAEETQGNPRAASQTTPKAHASEKSSEKAKISTKSVRDSDRQHNHRRSRSRSNRRRSTQRAKKRRRTRHSSESHSRRSRRRRSPDSSS